MLSKIYYVFGNIRWQTVSRRETPYGIAKYINTHEYIINIFDKYINAFTC